MQNAVVQHCFATVFYYKPQTQVCQYFIKVFSKNFQRCFCIFYDKLSGKYFENKNNALMLQMGTQKKKHQA